MAMRHWFRRNYRRLETLVVDRQLYRPGRLALVMLAMLALRGLGDDLWHGFGGGTASMFFRPEDRYADFIKVALTYRDYFAEQMAHRELLSGWPEIFKGFLGSVDYAPTAENLALPIEKTQIANLHLPPLATLLYVACARIIAATNPVIAMLIYWGLYAAGAWASAGMAARHFAFDRAGLWFCRFMVIGSFPAIWMLNRGNLAGGYSALLAVVYLATALSGRRRMWGLVALAFSINLRPEPALLALVELLADAPLRQRLTMIAIPAALSMAIAAMAFPLAHMAYPLYTLAHVRRGLEIYHYHYTVYDMGDEWNASLYMYAKGVLMLMDYRPRYSATVEHLFNLIGILAVTATIWGAWMRRLPRLDLVWLVSVLPAMFVPVYSYYHITELTPAMIMLVADLNARPPQRGDHRVALLIITTLVMSPLGGSYSNGLLASALMLTGTIMVMRPMLALGGWRALARPGLSAS